MTYAEQWTLSVALRRPVPGDTGDVLVDDKPPVVAWGEKEITEAAEISMRMLYLWGAIGTASGLLVGGLIGYAIGKGSK